MNMEDQKTATELAISSLSDRTQYIKDRRICDFATASATSYFADRVGDSKESDYKRIVMEVAELAAMIAIQEDRRAYQQEMKYLDNAMDAHLEIMSLRPMPIKITKWPFEGEI